MLDQTIRPSNVAVLFKLEATEGVDAGPSPASDAIPVEADSVSYNSPWTQEASNEATGSLVAGAPLIVGQAATIGFKSRIKGAGAGAVYSATVKPPLHQPLQACGWRGVYCGQSTGSVSAAGDNKSATLSVDFDNSADRYNGNVIKVLTGTAIGQVLAIVDYTAARLAIFGDTVTLAANDGVQIPNSWTYAQSSPSDPVSRATDQPSGTCYIYEDGVLLKFVGCRGTVQLDGQNARPGYATFSFTGIYAGRVDAAVPANLVIAGQSAPVLTQGTAASIAASLNRKAIPISTWSIDPGSTIEVPDNPNTPYGFDAGQIVDRVPVMKIDPLATLVANRNTIADIGAGSTYCAVLRHGSVAGNAWALIMPQVQPTETTAGTRGKLRSEQITLQCRSASKDAVGRDTDKILCFY